MVNFTIDAATVLDALHLTDEIAKSTVEKYIDRAIATIENELGVTIGEMSGDEGSKTIDVDKSYEPVIVALSAIYCICYITGGAAVGLNFSMGDLNVNIVSNCPPLSVFQAEVDRALGRTGEEATLKEIAFVVGEYSPS